MAVMSIILQHYQSKVQLVEPFMKIIVTMDLHTILVEPAAVTNLTCKYEVPVTIYCTWNKPADNILSEFKANIEYQVILYNSTDNETKPTNGTVINDTAWKYEKLGKFGNYSVNVTAMIPPNEHFNSSLSSKAESYSFPIDQGKSITCRDRSSELVIRIKFLHY